MERNDRRATVHRVLRAIVVTLTVLAACLVAANTASADFGIVDFGGDAVDTNGVALRQAGAHPNVSTTIRFTQKLDQDGNEVPDGNMKRITVDLPPGLIGNPTAAPRCSMRDLSTGFLNVVLCSAESQVGYVELDVALRVFGPSIIHLGLPAPIPVYNIEPPPGLPARFGFNLLGVVTLIDPSVRGGDNALSVDISQISQGESVVGARLTLWGVPADPVNDQYRYAAGSGSPGASSLSPRKPFMTSPTACSGQSLTTAMRAVSWQAPDDVKSASFDRDSNGDPMIVEGCDKLDFPADFSIRPESPTKQAAPAGIAVDLTVRQNENPDGLASAHLKKAEVTLPEGMTVNPSSSTGLAACTEAQIGLGNTNPESCPVASRIGSVEIATPLLEEPLSGQVYLAEQRKNKFGTTLAMYIVAKGPGIVLKLPGRIDTDPRTGRVTTTFDDNPQLPFSKFTLHFKTGPRAPLSLPVTCGPATTTAVLTPWSGTAPVTRTSTFHVSADGNGAPCAARGFAPKFNAGTTNAIAGRDASFVLGMSRTDLDEELSGISVTMPRGLLGRIGNVALCGDAQAAAGTCDEASRIGSVTTGAGAGSEPINLPGRVYITGPYKGAPFGLSIVVPAKTGPFDLGTVVVRAAVHVDRDTAQLRIDADPLPTILEGIPLQVRFVEVKVDRPGFMFNPTNCAPASIAGQISSAVGKLVGVGSRFQVGDCAGLKYQPRLVLRVGSRGHTRADVSTPLTAILTMPLGNANNRVVSVTLPRTMNARLEVLSNEKACSLAQYKADQCPINIGTATADTPLLREQLRGNVYLVRNPSRRLPDVVVALKGQGDAAGVAIDVTGKVGITRDFRVQNIFDTVPDAPITKFQLNFRSGRNGALGTVNNLCVARYRKASVAALAFTGQNNKKIRRNQTMQIVGCGRKATARRTGRRTTRRASTKKR